MKLLIALAVPLLLVSCASYTTEKAGDGMFTIKYRQSKYEPFDTGATLWSDLTPIMENKARAVCPQGYEKLREYRKVLPDMESYTAWDVRCLK